MAFTTPRTWVAAEIATAANLNTHLRDNMAWTATDSPCCRVYNNADFVHNSSGNYLAITMNSERFDNAAMHDTGSNTSRITVPTGGGGKYIVGCNVMWALSAGGSERTVSIRLNGTTTQLVRFGVAASATATNAQPLATVYALAAADYVEPYGWQNSGGSLSITAFGNVSPEAWAFWFRT